MEASRWQMDPAYTLTRMFFLVWLLCGQLVVKRLAIGLSAIRVDRLHQFTDHASGVSFPHSSGPYKIGALT
jgi:hypothetical protein